MSPVVDRIEGRRPCLGRYRAYLVEAPAQDALGRFVVEKQVALRIDEEERDAEVARELARSG
jgi:hypothetical protein